MYQAYILYSSSKDRFYIGSTFNLEERIKKHNTNHKGFTGGVGDWALCWSEIHFSREAAGKRERQIKSWKSRLMLENLIKA